MGDRLRETDGERDVDTVRRMPDRRVPHRARLGAPALEVAGAELEGLADVVTETTGDQDVPIDANRTDDLLQSLNETQGHRRHTAAVIGLRATQHRRAPGDTSGGNVFDPLELRL
jgi:hypothetical protein